MHFKQFNIKKTDNYQAIFIILNVQKKSKLRIFVDIHRFKDAW